MCVVNPQSNKLGTPHEKEDPWVFFSWGDDEVTCVYDKVHMFHLLIKLKNLDDSTKVIK